MECLPYGAEIHYAMAVKNNLYDALGFPYMIGYSTWEPGKEIPSGALHGITREGVESHVKSGSKLVKRSSVSRSKLDLQI